MLYFAKGFPEMPEEECTGNLIAAPVRASIRRLGEKFLAYSMKETLIQMKLHEEANKSDREFVRFFTQCNGNTETGQELAELFSFWKRHLERSGRCSSPAYENILNYTVGEFSK